MPSQVRYGEVKRYMERHGWSFSHASGSHHVFKKAGQRSYPVPVHNGKVDHVYFREIKKLCEGR